MNQSHQLINQDSGSVEYYTPSEIVEAARICMGGIDIDPFSCERANQVVQAAHFFTKEDDGLTKDWNGRIWINHPFSRKNNLICIDKLFLEHTKHMVEACCITFASTSEAWFQPLLRRPQCYMSPRVRYQNPDGTIFQSPPKGSVVTYVGPGSGLTRFASAFQHLGVIKVPYSA